MWAFTLAPPMSPTYVTISIASFLSLVTKQQFFQVLHQGLLFVCVPQVQIYQRHSFFRGQKGELGLSEWNSWRILEPVI